MTIDLKTVERAAKAHGYSLVADITALSEYGRAEETVIRSAEDACRTLGLYTYAEVEHFIVLTLDAAQKVVGRHVVSKGTLNQTLVHPRDVFRVAIEDNAAGIVLAHNHPSGSCFPSETDKKLTQRLTEAGRLLGIHVVDHVILAEGGWYSFAEEGWL